jgi:hypothetical protein
MRNEKRETRNEKRETRNEKRETRNEKRETRNEERETKRKAMVGDDNILILCILCFLGILCIVEFIVLWVCLREVHLNAIKNNNKKYIKKE